MKRKGKSKESSRSWPLDDWIKKASESLSRFRDKARDRSKEDMATGLAGAAALYAFLLYRKTNAKKFRQGEEYGSARWGTPKDIAPFIDPVFENNILLTRTERLTMSSRPKNPKYARNKNVIVIGGSGSGKTRGYVKPNLMQCESSTYPVSFVVTDPKITVSAILIPRYHAST